MNSPKVYADFQNLNESNQIRLNCAGTLRDLEREGIRLQDGLVLTLYTDDADDDGLADELMAEGIVRFDEAEGCWIAEIDWSELRHASDEAIPNARREIA